MLLYLFRLSIGSELPLLFKGVTFNPGRVSSSAPRLLHDLGVKGRGPLGLLPSVFPSQQAGHSFPLIGEGHLPFLEGAIGGLGQLAQTWHLPQVGWGSISRGFSRFQG